MLIFDDESAPHILVFSSYAASYIYMSSDSAKSRRENKKLKITRKQLELEIEAIMSSGTSRTRKRPSTFDDYDMDGIVEDELLEEFPQQTDENSSDSDDDEREFFEVQVTEDFDDLQEGLSSDYGHESHFVQVFPIYL